MTVNIDRHSLFAATRIGRPPIADPTSERSRKPWIAAGISERTYYRRKALLPPEPIERDAHVIAWLATLDWPARLDFKAWARRCAMGTRRVDPTVTFGLYERLTLAKSA